MYYFGFVRAIEQDVKLGSVRAAVVVIYLGFVGTAVQKLY